MLKMARKVDEWIQIGRSICVAPTDIDPHGARLLAKGRMIGGPDDGAPFEKTADLGKGGEMRLGPHVVITVIDIVGDSVRLGVNAPPSISIHRKEVADQISRDGES